MASTIDLMAILAAKVWHYWISIFLLVPIVLIILALALGYFVKVVAPKYTRK